MSGEPEVLVRVEGRLGHLTLNRPKALNALTDGMVRLIDDALTAWEGDDAVSTVLIDGAGERGLCAGGDIRAIHDAARAGDLASPVAFWAEEYRLNARLASYPKPIVALMTGIVMGGGVGISAHCRHRIVSETTTLAMPETGIGFVPDVGGTFLLARAPGELGTHLGLTADRCGAADAIGIGFADSHVATDRLPALVEAMRTCPADEVENRLASFASEPAPGRLAAARGWIDACYAAETAEEIAGRLAGRPEEEAARAFRALRANSPTSVKVTLRLLREARRLGRLEACLAMELRAAAACIAGYDMPEGIRAAVIDKDRAPRWHPSSLEEVGPDIVERHLRPLGTDELDFAAKRAAPRPEGRRP